MYYPSQENGQWVVKLGDKIMGPAPTKGDAFRLASYMNGGDYDLVLNPVWEYFIGGAVSVPQVTPPLVVDMTDPKNVPQL